MTIEGGRGGERGGDGDEDGERWRGSEMSTSGMEGEGVRWRGRVMERK